MRSYGATGLQTMRKLRLPAALPFVFNALKLNSTLALIGAIVAEFFGTPIVGMGFRISTEAARLDLDVVWAEILLAALTGSALFATVALLERVTTFWRPAFQPPPPSRGNAMKKIITLAICAFVLMSGTARAADKVTLQLKWSPRRNSPAITSPKRRASIKRPAST